MFFFIALSAIGFVLISISASDIIEIIKENSALHFGTEIGGWKYSSKANFVSFNIAQSLLGSLLIIISFFKGKSILANW